MSTHNTFFPFKDYFFKNNPENWEREKIMKKSYKYFSHS